MTRRRIDIDVPTLARVEGEGALELRIEDDAITELRLRIFEPPRLFEKFIEGHPPDDVVDMVARICGICPVAYQVSAARAFEALFAIELPPSLTGLRRAMYCGEWIQSHALHIHLLAAPDFLGAPDATALAHSHPEIIQRGLRLQALGNRLIRLFGGRSVHPVGLKVGGFHRLPEADAVAELVGALEAALPEADELVRWSATLPLPQRQQTFTCLALDDPEGYPITGSTCLTSDGNRFSIEDFESHVHEFQVPHSTAFHAHLDGRPYLVGPLARLNLHHQRLPEAIQALINEIGLTLPSGNPFHSLTARAIEIRYALAEAARLLRQYLERPARAAHIDGIPCAGTGFGASEAPRGLLWHRYDSDPHGLVTHARIIPPTAQNQERIEEDLRLELTHFGLHHDADTLRRHAEQIIRNYDPCISCATHFLELRIRR